MDSWYGGVEEFADLAEVCGLEGRTMARPSPRVHPVMTTVFIFMVPKASHFCRWANIQRSNSGSL